MADLSLLLAVLPCLSLLLGYLNNNAFPTPLSEAEEKRCLELFAKGEKEARNMLIEHNLRLVAHISKKFENTGLDKEDLISIGTIGLIKAINTYSIGKNSRLATYAARCIENEILMHLRATKHSRGELSLNDPVGVDKEGNEMTLLELLNTGEDEILHKIETKDEERVLWDTLSVLSPKEKYVIILRFGLGNNPEKTQREIAKQLGISRSYVSRIEKKAVHKLTKELKKNTKNA
ncbi:MAG: RNA polymerase sporulation sigma factor SigK [Clostridia bacterium]|jgi:RNA polymerase sporulation-specific sigma factor|nr:RNA polymerase sporulation sigma factor SigK [Clostridia bacterium]MDD4572263.1 RNA polymerase sporulation sigma factor SigK [Clostridia bacterium]